MKKFIDNVQNVILDIRYENKVFERMNNEPADEYEEELLELMLDEEPEEPSRDIYGNIIGESPILYGPLKTSSNVKII